MTTNYDDYFDNVLSRSWIGEQQSRTSSHIELSSITDIYLVISNKNKIIILGKTEKFYFILEGFDSDNFKYANGLYNSNIVSLINGYKNRDSFTNGVPTQDFVDKMLLHDKLQNRLPEKQLSNIKKRKI
jgi:hypothetical protein